MTVLFIGAGFFPWLTSGEKNFFFRLFPLLQQETDVAVFSLNDYHQPLLFQETEAGSIPVFCAKRPFHRNYDRFFFQGNGYTSYHHRHKPPQEIAEKFAAICTHLPKLRQIVRERQVKVIHFMDNFGPAMPFLRYVLPQVKVTFSAANYDPRGRRGFYDRYLKYSIGYLDGAGVYTQAYMQVLRQLGLRNYLAPTPWGVPVEGEPLTLADKSAIRQTFGVPDNHYLLLWSGYLQQIQESDFYKTTAVARQVTQQRSDVSFVFAFKPETYQPAYAAEAGERIQVVKAVKNFTHFLETADLFLSPIGNTRSTVSPPLTWIEAMSKGTPIVTTAVGGVDEIITHGQTGYVAPSYDQLAPVLVQALDREGLTAVSHAAQAHIHQHHTLQHAAQHYLNLWQNVQTQ